MHTAIKWIRDRAVAIRQKLGELWGERLRVPGRTEYAGENADLDPPDLGGLL